MKYAEESLEVLFTLLKDQIISENENEQLPLLLEKWNMSELLNYLPNREAYSPKGKILVLGESSVPQDKLLGVAKKLGYNKKRFEFRNYRQCKGLDSDEISRDSYSLILIGPTPHSVKGSGKNSSLATKLESDPDRYPPTVRLSSNQELKITKTNFQEALKIETDNGVICPDYYENFKQFQFATTV